MCVAHPGLREDAHCGRASTDGVVTPVNVNDEILVFLLVGSVVAGGFTATNRPINKALFS